VYRETDLWLKYRTQRGDREVAGHGWTGVSGVRGVMRRGPGKELEGLGKG
jgi:hypothetical protein